MDHEGGNVRRLTYDVITPIHPPGPPRGRLAMVARTSGGFDIYTCRSDGSDTRLASAVGATRIPAGHRTDDTSFSHRIATVLRPSTSRT